MIRPPEAPIGWPSAIAPPLTLTFSSSMPSIRTELIATEAKASLISQRSTSSARLAGLVEAELGGLRGRPRQVGVVVGDACRSRGPWPAPACRSPAAHSSEATTTAAAPSLTPGRVAGRVGGVVAADRLAASRASRRWCRGGSPRRPRPSSPPSATLTVTGDDLVGEPALVGRLGGELVRADGPAVEVGAGDLELVADLARLVDHLLARERVGEPVVGHRVDRLRRRPCGSRSGRREAGRGRCDIDSMPPPTPTPTSPARIAWSSRPTARMPEAQTLLTVSEGTSLGIPASICAWREGSVPGRPAAPARRRPARPARDRRPSARGRPRSPCRRARGRRARRARRPSSRTGCGRCERITVFGIRGVPLVGRGDGCRGIVEARRTRRR